MFSIAGILNLCSSHFLTNYGFGSTLKFASYFFPWNLSCLRKEFYTMLVWYKSYLLGGHVCFHITLNAVAFLNWGLCWEFKCEFWTSEKGKTGWCFWKHWLEIPVLSCVYCRDNAKVQLHKTHSYFHNIRYYFKNSLTFLERLKKPVRTGKFCLSYYDNKKCLR